MLAVYQQVTRAALVGLCINLMLGAAKLIGGIAGNSFALISDSINSLGDVVATIVVLYAIKVAQRPPDPEHPYGHTRAEAIAATNVAVLIIVSALGIAWEALQRIGADHELPHTWTLWIALVNIVIKEGLYQYNVHVGRQTKSQAIMAGAWDHRSDALCALAVLIGLAAVRVGGASWMWADEAAALVVVVAILWSATKLFRAGASELMDLQADDELVEQIKSHAAAVTGVLGVETLWVRKSGLEYFVDVHIEVNPAMTVAAGHDISHAVKDQLIEKFPHVRDVLVHLEPHAMH